MIKILHIVSALDSGGVESMLVNYYENMRRDDIKFDFITHDLKIGMIEKQLIDMNSEVYHVVSKKENFLKNYNQMRKIIKNGNYDIVHCHQNFSSAIPLYIAKRNKTKVRIAHSHCTQDAVVNRENLLNKFLRRIILKNANYLFACSQDAGNFLFKNNNNFITIRNAINLKRFSFNNKNRNEIRNRYKIQKNDILIGNIGRFCIHKNQIFLLEIFKVLHSKNKNVKLMLIGEGELKDEIQKKIKKEKIEEYVTIVSPTKDIEKYYSAMDLFILPSISEGFGMALIEAQANGLKCITSLDVIPKETVITDKQVTFISLEKLADFWAKKIEEIIHNEIFNIDNLRVPSFINNNYNIENEAIKLEKIYKNCKEEQMQNAKEYNNN